MAASVKVTTGKVRLSYPHIFKTHEDPSGKEQFSASLIIPKSDKRGVQKIKDAISEMMRDKDCLSKWGGKIPKKFWNPLQDGDDKDDAAYADSYYINAKANPDYPPKVFDKDRNEVVDPSEVYAGCYVQAVINLYAFAGQSNSGIGVGLAGIRKLADGAPLSGSTISDDDWSDDYDDYDVDDLI